METCGSSTSKSCLSELAVEGGDIWRWLTLCRSTPGLQFMTNTDPWSTMFLLKEGRHIYQYLDLRQNFNTHAVNVAPVPDPYHCPRYKLSTKCSHAFNYMPPISSYMARSSTANPTTKYRRFFVSFVLLPNFVSIDLVQ